MHTDLTRPAVTVVVCSYHGRDRIGRTLDMLAAQTAASRMRVLVVDDGSKDGTDDAARAHGADVVVHEVNRGLAAARNTGLRAATTPLVAFTDDDCEPEPTWIAELLAAQERHPDAAAWGGPAPSVVTDGFWGDYLTRTDPLSPLEKDLASSDAFLYRLARYLVRSAQPAPTGERDVFSLAGANIMLDREKALAAGAFDERFRFGGEEEDLFRRLDRAGERIVFTPEAVVGHRFEYDVADLVRRSRAYGRGNARMHAKHAEMTPTIYPAPLLVAGALLAGVRRPAFLLAAAAIPQALFSRWPREALAERDPRLLAYPYVQLLQEGASNIGWLDFLRRERRGFTAAPASSTPTSATVTTVSSTRRTGTADAAPQPTGGAA